MLPGSFEIHWVRQYLVNVVFICNKKGLVYIESNLHTGPVDICPNILTPYYIAIYYIPRFMHINCSMLLFVVVNILAWNLSSLSLSVSNGVYSSLGIPWPAGLTRLTHIPGQDPECLGIPLGIQGSLNRRHTSHTYSQSEGDTPKHCHIGWTLSQISQPHLHSVWDHCY